MNDSSNNNNNVEVEISQFSRQDRVHNKEDHLSEQIFKQIMGKMVTLGGFQKTKVKKEGAEVCSRTDKVDTKFLINTLLKGKIIQKHDIPSFLTAIFEVSLMKHSELGLLPSNSSSNGGGGAPHPNDSYHISREENKVIILSSESSHQNPGSHYQMELLVCRNGSQKIKSDRSHKSRQPKQKDSHVKSRGVAPW